MIVLRHHEQVGRAHEVVSAMRFRPEARGEEGAMDCLDAFTGRLSCTPSLERLLDAYMGNFTGRGIPKSQPVHTITIEVVVAGDEVAGMRLPVRIPVFKACQICEGTGRTGFFECDRCRGQGITADFRTVDVLLPARITGKTTVPVSLGGLGIRNLHIDLRIRPSQSMPDAGN
jgi:hypothetical protein